MVNCYDPIALSLQAVDNPEGVVEKDRGLGWGSLKKGFVF